MTSITYARHLFDTYGQYWVHGVGPMDCKHEILDREVRRIVQHGKGTLTLEVLGHSLEGRSINIVRAGKGPTHVLLWSQMHGDEPTATLALLDIFTFLAQSTETWVAKMLDAITIHAIPMLNPDGAERTQRVTAVHIDMNRDAKMLNTPEASVLREAQYTIQPAFGFNLHDQELSTVGTTRKVAALALLAPHSDEEGSVTPVRLRAIQVGASVVAALNQFVEGHIATYDDTHEPRAFGDGMQTWGTSTLLIESGHWPGDRTKSFVRKLNAVGILSALSSIADGSFADADVGLYNSLHPNGKKAFDVIIRNVWMLHPDGWKRAVDIGLTAEPVRNRTTLNRPLREVVVTVKEVGDLSTYSALENVEGFGRAVETTALAIDRVLPLGELLDACR